MNIIKELQEKYFIEYDAKDKILWIKSNIPVSDFMLIRKIVELKKDKVKEIRVN